MKRIDARGMSCPQPVLMTKKVVEENSTEFEVIVDNSTAKENVTRYGKNAGYKIEVTNAEDDFIIQMRK